jgi:hypothetical protein
MNPVTPEEIASIGRRIGLKKLFYAALFGAVAASGVTTPWGQSRDLTEVCESVALEIGVGIAAVVCLVRAVGILSRARRGSFGTTDRDCKDVVAYLSRRSGRGVLLARGRTSDAGLRP